MVKTVPVTITSPALRDLQYMGFPFLLVNRWDDVNKELLETWYSENYHTINWNHVRNLLRVETIFKIIMEEYPFCKITSITL
jgi:hypothetical protein